MEQYAHGALTKQQRQQKDRLCTSEDNVCSEHIIVNIGTTFMKLPIDIGHLNTLRAQNLSIELSKEKPSQAAMYPDR